MSSYEKRNEEDNLITMTKRMMGKKWAVYLFLISFIWLFFTTNGFSQCENKSKYQIVFKILNKFPKEVRVAVHYQDMDGYWVTSCWKTLRAFGEFDERGRINNPDSLIIDMSCRDIYISAQISDGSGTFGNTEFQFSVCGSVDKHSFFKYTIPKAKKKDILPGFIVYFYEYSIASKEKPQRN